MQQETQVHLAVPGGQPMQAQRPLTPAMLRELRSIEHGNVGDLLDYGQNALAFYARDRVIGALERRGLIEANPDWSLTDAGRAALKAASS